MWRTETANHRINNLLFYLENSVIVFGHLSVTKQGNALLAAELITVHYVCLEDFSPAQKD